MSLEQAIGQIVGRSKRAEAVDVIAQKFTLVNGRVSIPHLQQTWKEWSTRNFGPSFQPVPGMPYRPLIGMMEELGELAHAHLKKEQNIRLNEDHEGNAKDSIGDLFMFMMDYCNGRGWDIEEIITKTACHVLRRDWTADPTMGVSQQEQGTA